MVSVHMDSAKRDPHPFAVIVFPMFDGHVIWVKHPRRGWEVPGGKVDPGETPDEAAVREVFEESGAEIENLQWIGEYTTPDGQHKWIYFADVMDVHARPEDSEIVDVMVPRPLWSPDVANDRNDVSFIMQDEMYEGVWPLLLEALNNH